MTNRKHYALLALGLGLAACSSGPDKAARLATGPAMASVTDVDPILRLLDQGEEKAARKRIAAALKLDPMNPSLLVLRDSTERDPKELLGPTSFAYTVKPGETMTGLAQRFLGNRLKAYQLARYNGVQRPDSLAAGQELRIPGQLPRVEQARPEPAAKPARRPDAVARPKPAAPRPVAPKPAAPVAAAPTANPAGARQARAAGLAALNQGQVGRALGLLRRARSMDPANPVIVRDLQRAERIASTVKARR